MMNSDMYFTFFAFCESQLHCRLRRIVMDRGEKNWRIIAHCRNDLRIGDRRCNLNGFMVLPAPLTQLLPRASNFRSHLLMYKTDTRARMCVCSTWYSTIHTHTYTNFSVMVDRVASRFGRSDETSPREF